MKNQDKIKELIPEIFKLCEEQGLTEQEMLQLPNKLHNEINRIINKGRSSRIFIS